MADEKEKCVASPTGKSALMTQPLYIERVNLLRWPFEFKNQSRLINRIILRTLQVDGFFRLDYNVLLDRLFMVEEGVLTIIRLTVTLKF